MVIGSRVLMPPPTEAICNELKIKDISINLLAGDGSDRCYFRLFSSELKDSRVLMQLSGSDALALKEGGYDWVRIAEIFKKRDIFFPELISIMPKYAALIIEDYGDVMLENYVIERIHSDDIRSAERIYHKSIEIISKFLGISKDPGAVWCQRGFNEEKYLWELNFFKSKFIETALDIKLSKNDEDSFLKDSMKLSSFLSSFSKYFVHRDFHSRNLMIKKDKLATIDFQDARIGSPAYDLVSLCFDAYVPMSMEMRNGLFQWAKEKIAKDHGPQIKKEIEDHWKAMLLQRQLKAIGSFAFLTIDKKRGNYLRYVDPAAQTIREIDVFDERWPFISRKIVDLISTFNKKDRWT